MVVQNDALRTTIVANRLSVGVESIPITGVESVFLVGSKVNQYSLCSFWSCSTAYETPLFNLCCLPNYLCLAGTSCLIDAHECCPELFCGGEDGFGPDKGVCKIIPKCAQNGGCCRRNAPCSKYNQCCGAYRKQGGLRCIGATPAKLWQGKCLPCSKMGKSQEDPQRDIVCFGRSQRQLTSLYPAVFFSTNLLFVI